MCLLCAGCDVDIPMNESKSCLPQEDHAATLTKNLSKNDIPHVYDMDTKCIYFSNAYRDQVESMKRNIFGEPPPLGLSISWVDRNDELLAILQSNGINTKTYNYYETEYIAWSYKDRLKVEELLELEPWKKEMYKNFREESEMSPNKSLQPTANASAD